MISNINTNTALVDQGYTGVAATEATDNTSQTKSVDNQANNTESDSISLSTRAQKLSAIASEFFNGKSVDSLDINQLVERAYEYGLLSQTQYSALGGGQETESTGNEITATQGVVQYIDDLKVNLNKLDNEYTFGEVSLTELQETLDNARVIITSVNMTQNNTSLSQSIAESKQVLTLAFESDEFSAMTKEDQLTMESIIKTLSVIEELNTSQNEKSVVNAYKDVAQY